MCHSLVFQTWVSCHLHALGAPLKDWIDTMSSVLPTPSDEYSDIGINQMFMDSAFQACLDDWQANVDTSQNNLSTSGISTGGSSASINATSHQSSEGSVDTAMEDEAAPWRKVSLVVEKCDTNTFNYLINISKSLKGKAKVEIDV